MRKKNIFTIRQQKHFPLEFDFKIPLSKSVSVKSSEKMYNVLIILDLPITKEFYTLHFFLFWT